MDVFSGKERVLAKPVYSVSTDGTFALSLDFSRLHRMRPGYGYYNLPDSTKDEKVPCETAIWRLDILKNTVSPVLSYSDFYAFEPRQEMTGAEHKVNHIMLNPSGNRFMVLHRWFNGQRKYSRLITVNVDGSEMFNLSDDDMVSHCFWKDDQTILAFENKHDQGIGYYLMVDKTKEYQRLWPHITEDGHPSYNYDRTLVVTDTYPNRARLASLRVMTNNRVYDIAKVFAPFKYDNDTRCDLHPRWSRDGSRVFFDSVFEGHRGLYMIALPKDIHHSDHPIVDQSKLVSCVIPSYKRCDTVTRAIDSVLSQTYKNIEICVVDDNVPGDEYSIALQNVLKQYKTDGRVRYISQEKHINGAVARNAGIKAARGEYIAFLDDDDEWLPTKIEKQISILLSDASIGGVTSLWMQCKEGIVTRHCPAYTTDNFQFKVLSRQISVFSSTVLIRKSVIDKFRGFDGDLIRHQDLQFLVDAASITSFSVVPEYLVKLHTDSEINRPALMKFINAKYAFFNSVRKEIEKYDNKDKKRIICAHYFEVVVAAIKAKKYGIALKYLAKIGINLAAYRDLYQRYMGRKE